MRHSVYAIAATATVAAAVGIATPQPRGNGVDPAPGRLAAASISVDQPASQAGLVGNHVAGGTPIVSREVRYTLPLSAPVRVVRGFSPPATRYGPGHLGVDLAARPPLAVLAAADGTVRFAGRVAGRQLVVLAHADGIRTEYEPLTPAVRVGAVVRRGQLLGVVSGRHRGCPGVCLHWGARRGAAYVDPLSLLRPLAPVRLMPWPRDQARG